MKRDWATHYQKYKEYQQWYRTTDQCKKAQLRYRQDNREKKREHDRARYYADPQKHINANREYRQAHPEKVKASQKKYRQAHPEKMRKYQNIFYHKHPEKVKAYHDKYRLANLEKHNEYQKRYSKENPKYRRALNASQLIPKKSACEKCGSRENLQKHHPDYTKPTQFQTLCKRCHLKNHGRNPVQQVIINA